MILLPPIATKHDPRTDLTSFWWEGEERLNQRIFFVRGAISWPEEFIPGYALIAAQDPGERTVFVFEEFSFWTIEPYLKTDLREAKDYLAQPGLGQWLMTMWARYACRTFYWHQRDDIHRRYSLVVYEDKTILPKPELIPVPIVEQLGDNLILEYGRLGRLHADQRSDLKVQMEKHFAVPEAKSPGPGVHALRCLLAGLEHAGWREYQAKEKEKVVYV